MITPVVGHPVWELDLQRRIREARVDAAARSVGRAKGRRSLLDRVLSRPRPPEPHVGDLRDRGDDVWKALRF